jgi:hypothetical protein
VLTAAAYQTWTQVQGLEPLAVNQPLLLSHSPAPLSPCSLCPYAPYPPPPLVRLSTLTTPPPLRRLPEQRGARRRSRLPKHARRHEAGEEGECSKH